MRSNDEGITLIDLIRYFKYVSTGLALGGGERGICPGHLRA